MKGKQRILNTNIKAKKVKLIDENGENIGDMNLQDALKKANYLGLDLMQLSVKGDEAIVKMLDYGKFLYKQKKQDQKNKQKTKTPDLKTIKITFKIGEHDLQTRQKQAEKFSKLGHPLKVFLQLRGRENQYGNLAFEKMEAFANMIEDFYKMDNKIMKQGNNFMAIFQPKK